MVAKYVTKQVGFADIDRTEQALDAAMRPSLRFLASEWERDCGIAAAENDPGRGHRVRPDDDTGEQ
jgi:hypothetical protein